MQFFLETLCLSDLIIFAVLNICQNMRIIMIGTLVIGSSHWWLEEPLAMTVASFRSIALRISFGLEAGLLWLCVERRQTFTTLFRLSLGFDIFWWSVTFYKSFEFIFRFCHGLRGDTKLLTDHGLGDCWLLSCPVVAALICRHFYFFWFSLRSARLSSSFDNTAQVLHVRFWNRD